MAGKPNILIIWGDDIGYWNISAYSKGMMGYKTPNIDRIANEGMTFTDCYGEQSCTAGRAAFIMGQSVFRSGLSKVGLPGAAMGMRSEDPTIAELLKPLGYATGQFGKNHLGDRDEHLPTQHGFDEFFGNLYHLNAEEEPELRDYPPEQDFPNFRQNYGPRGVLHCWANPDGTQKIEDTGPLTKKRMQTVDDEFLAAAQQFIKKQHADDTLVMYSTDNGPHMNSWPDAAMTPFRSEKNSNWEGAFRVPQLIRWPGKIRSGVASNEIMSHLDWMPTLLGAAGMPDIKEKLLGGYKAGDKTFKVHLDGYNFLPYLTGQETKSPRVEYFYFSDDGDLMGLR